MSLTKNKWWCAAAVLAFASGCFLEVDVGDDFDKGANSPCRGAQDWTCNDDPSVSTLCGACVGTSAGYVCACKPGHVRTPSGRCAPAPTGSCTVGMDQTCNADPLISSVAGTCVWRAYDAGTGTECICGPGFELDPSGRCRAVTHDVCTLGDDSTCWATWEEPVDAGVDAGASLDAGRGSHRDGLHRDAGARPSCDAGLGRCGASNDGGAAVVAGQCIATDVGTRCLCAPGFFMMSSGRCAPVAPRVCTVGMDQTCNAIPTMSSLAGSCVGGPGWGTHCECRDGFALDDSGRCAPSLCYEVTPTGCRYVFSDGRSPGSGTCGPISLSPGCSCARDDRGEYHAYCMGACMPATAPSMSCSPSCGPIRCVEGQTRCVAFGRCE